MKKHRHSKSKKKKANLSINITNWNTTDKDEIERRQLRAEIEKFRIINLNPSQPYFSTYSISSSQGHKKYTVEIRSLDQPLNSCDCPDYKTNALGTCKHIEALLVALKKKGMRKFKHAIVQGHEYIEIFLDRLKTPTIRVLWPEQAIPPSIKKCINLYFSSDGSLLGDPVLTFQRLVEDISNKKHKERIRVSKHIQYYIDHQKMRSQKHQAQDCFIKDVKLGKRMMDFLKHPLFPYQQEGMLHLAFTQRALLADEMGLGKTVQAIAACELLKQLHGIERVLVITTASLKTEWEEQIAKFTDLSSLIISGSRTKRLKQYQQNQCFYLMNYEQVVLDHAEIQRLLAPDVIILDEAQRIKNWRTKTAGAVKELKSPYAFVLTGTPIENRIDDIYSIVQFLDPHIFGPLFRFNRDFYELDEEGRPIGYKNLDKLYHRLRPIMLCRKKHDVEDELPKRLNKHYFVKMDREQSIRYEAHETSVARLVHLSKKRPLRKQEFERLQKGLACMRMICDTPYILDENCETSPKLNELETILKELFEDRSNKIIIFSEWERMLQLVRKMANANNWEVAWHTGRVPQHKRRENIRHFKKEPNCQLFLSTDAGSVGLNLQVANVVINLDLPWNPAKLEQRIARAWRKHQKRSVQVINLICEHSIEHRMLHLLEQKELMAKGVLTGDASLKSMKMPSGRAAFMERMEALMTSEATERETTFDISQRKSAEEINQAKNNIIEAFDENLNLLQTYQSDIKKQPIMLAVVNDSSKKAQEKFASAALQNEIPIEMIDQKTMALIQRLAKLGILTLHEPLQILHDQTSDEIKRQRLQKRAEKATHYLSQAQQKQRMTHVLLENDFIDEALPSLQEAFKHSINAFLYLTDTQKDTPEKLTPNTLATLTSQYSDLTSMSSLFISLVVSNKENLDVKKLHQEHQAILTHLIQMNVNLVARNNEITP